MITNFQQFMMNCENDKSCMHVSKITPMATVKNQNTNCITHISKFSSEIAFPWSIIPVIANFTFNENNHPHIQQ